MGRGLTRSRSKTRFTAKEKMMAHKRKRSMSAVKSKIEREGEMAPEDYANDDDEYELAEYEHEQESISESDVVEKYRYAAKFVQQALEQCVVGCVPGASVLALCQASDKLIQDGCDSVYTKKKDEEGLKVFKGVAVPTNISVNDVVAYFRPITPGEDVVIQSGDVVKINCGCHIDGYPVQVAHTVAVGGADGSTADCIVAAQTCAEAALRLMRPDLDSVNHNVTDAFSAVADDFGVSICEGVLSHRVRRWCIDGPHTIISAKVNIDDAFQDVDMVSFGTDQVWHVDIAVSTKHEVDKRPKLHRAECPTSLFKRNDIRLVPRVKAAHYVLRDIRDRFASMPFAVSSFDEPARARMGLQELIRMDMIDPLPVMKVRKTEVSARFCWTVMITERGIVKLTGMPAQAELQPTRRIENLYLADVLSRGLVVVSDAEKKRREAKKARRAAGSAAPADAAPAATATGGAVLPAKRRRRRSPSARRSLGGL